jgi:nitroreductase
MGEFMDAMAFRHACKRFDASRAIPEEEFETILEAGRLSPSSFGMEPWRLLVVRSKALREALKPLCWNQNQITEASELVVFTTDNESVRGNSAYAKAMFERRGLDEAATAAYLKRYADYMAPLEADARLLEDWTAKQCYIMAANMMTCAASMRIDSCPIEGFDRADVQRCLELGPGRSVALIAAFGYRLNPQGERKRLELGEIVAYL